MSTSAVQSVVPKSMPRVLRVGIVRDGKVVREHVCKSGETVIAGTGPDAQVEVSGEGIPARLELFAFRGGMYYLQVPEGVDGKIQWSDGVKGMDQLRELPEVKQVNGLTVVPLNENVRGKVVVATTSVLFQFVDAPPEPLKPISPADFKPKFFDEEDPLFIGLLLLFSGVAAAFMVMVQFIEVPPESDADLLQRAQKLMLPKIEKVEAVDPNAVGEEPAEEAEKKEPEKKEPEKTEAKADAGPKPQSAPSVESLSRRSLLIAALGTAGEGQGEASDVLGDGGANRLAGALSGVSGVEAASGGNIGLASGSGGGAGDTTVAIGGAGGGSAETATMAVKVKKPKVDYGAADIDADAGDPEGIRKVVQTKKSAVTSCTEQALKTNPNLNGRVTVGWTIQAGKTTGVRVVDNSTGDAALGECIARAVRSLRFSEEVTATIDGYSWIVSGQ